MKQRLKLLAVTFFLVLGISNLGQAQKLDPNDPDQGSASTATTTRIDPTSGNTIAENSAIKALFLTLYPNATAQKWSQNGSNSFVYFLLDGRNASACFSAKGKLKYVITECRKEHLPEELANRIRKNYEGYRLFRAMEIKAYGETAWQAILENNSGFITLKYTLDGIEEMQIIKK